MRCQSHLATCGGERTRRRTRFREATTAPKAAVGLLVGGTCCAPCRKLPCCCAAKHR